MAHTCDIPMTGDSSGMTTLTGAGNEQPSMSGKAGKLGSE